jgi:hypothetical protein
MSKSLREEMTHGCSQRSLERSGAWSGNKKMVLKTALLILGGMIIGLIATLILRVMSKGLSF